MPDSVVGPRLAAVRAPVGVVRGAGRGVALTVAAWAADSATEPWRASGEHPDIGADHLFTATGSWRTKSWGVSHCWGHSIRVPGQLPLISEALLCRGNLEY